MKPIDPLYWQKRRQANPEKYAIKRSPLVRKPVKIKANKPESLGRLIQRAVTVFHKWIRERDSDGVTFVCISCHKEKPVSQMHAGHYLPGGNNGVIRLNEWNVNGQCDHPCNLDLHGNQENYRVGLIGKIGLENVEALEAMAKVPHKWDRVELERIIREYKV